METHENDLLFTNVFINTPDIVSNDSSSKEFRDFYVQQNKSVKEPSINSSIKEVALDTISGSKRYTREIKTFVSIDSRNRDTILYPTPANFKIFLGKTFYNVRSVRMASMEFPNTNAVINSTNNNIYWINKEDIDLDIIDTVTQTYPIYNVQLRIGSYIATKLESEIDSKLHLVKRRNKTGDYHYFVTDLDIETDVVTFTSLIIKQAGAGPLSTTSSTGLIKVEVVAHGYSTGETIYILGARNIAGIGSASINGAHIITVLNVDEFQFEIQVKATSTDTGGGSNLKTGRLAPFQLLFGDYQKTVAKNIGYLYENSSEQIIVNIKSMENYIQVQLTTTIPHGVTRTRLNIGSTVTIASSGTTPDIDGTRVISDVLSETSLLISVNSALDVPSFLQGTVTIGGNPYSLASIENFKSKTILLTTFTDHNYIFEDSGKEMTLYSTVSKPSFDGTNIIYMRLSSTELILYGEILTGGSVNVVTPGDAGFTPLHNPITSVFYTILEITPGVVTTIRLTEPHILKIGDRIKLYNVFSNPNIIDKTSGVHVVYSIVSADTFTINTETITINTKSIELGEAAVGTSTLYVKFPGHGFNTITSITNGTIGTVVVETLLNHGYTTGDTMRISSSNTVPSVDDGGYVVTVLTPDTFSIIFPVVLTTAGTYGIVGISTQFSMYRVMSVAGFPQDVLNNNRFHIRDVIDEDNFNFDIFNYFSTSLEVGGGTGIFMNSFLHGFNGTQTNTKNGLIDRSISLEGENYAFLTCQQLGSMKNTGDVKDIFARVTLDQSPGMMVFNFLSNPKDFDETPLDKLEDLEFSMINFDNSFYEFNDLDYSFVLEITEVVDADYAFNVSSKRGINDTLRG